MIIMSSWRRHDINCWPHLLTPYEGNLISDPPVWVRMCRRSNEGLSNFFPHTSQGNHVRSRFLRTGSRAGVLLRSKSLPGPLDRGLRPNVGDSKATPDEIRREVCEIVWLGDGIRGVRPAWERPSWPNDMLPLAPLCEKNRHEWKSEWISI